MMANDASFLFEQVHKSFGDVRALHPTTLSIANGEFLTLLGPSGSGKTTLLNIAAGYIAPDGGRVVLAGRDLTSLPPRQRNIGMVFQSYALFPHMSVFENVAYGLRVRRRPQAEIERRVASALESVKLGGFERRGVQQLSGGQQQRVALARALVIEPDLLLMDEPLGALDRQLRKHVQIEIRRMHVAARRTTIYVTHDQEEALVMSDRIAVMSQGRIEQVGTPDDLYRSPKNVFVATFLGESNLLPVDSLILQAGSASFCIAGSREMWSIASTLPGSANLAVLLIRPEHLSLARTDEPALSGTIAEIVYLGELTAIRIALDAGRDVWMRQMNLPRVSAGDKVRVRWDPMNARLLETDQTNKIGGTS